MPIFEKTCAFFRALAELFAIGDDGDCQEPEYRALPERARR